jgi:hypothetical protein
MSDTVINLSAYTDGLLTDLTSLTFSDEAATYGLKRTDTGATVLAAGASFPRLALGTYQKTFADPAASLTYEYTLKVVTGGTTYYYNRITLAGTISHILTIPTSSHYSSQSEVARQLGNMAIQLMMEDWESNDTSPVWDDILEEVDETIDFHIEHKYPRRSFTNTFLRRLATKLACSLISARRGNPGLYVREANAALNKLELIRAGEVNIPGSIAPNYETGAHVRNYVMQPFIHHPMRVETTKSTGNQYPGMDFAFEPYLIVA